LCFEKELAACQLYRIQEKRQMTKGEIRREKETQTRTQTETSLCFEKELAGGQLYRRQESMR
jgi:hypothetical protein